MQGSRKLRCNSGRLGRAVWRGIVLATTLSAPAMAELDSMCGLAGQRGWEAVQQALIGDWQVEHQAGYVRMGGMVLAFPADGEVETLTIWQMGDELQATHPEAQAPLVLTPADEPRWTVESDDARVPKPMLSPDDVALVAGCAQTELPRVIGTTTTVMDGTHMDFTYRMMGVDAQTLYGVMHMSAFSGGVPVDAYRTVWMRRGG